MREYLEVMRDVMERGIDRPDRTGVGTRAVFGRQMRFNMQDGFPAVTTKKLFFKAVVHELLWFLSGSADARELQKHGVHIWDGNAEAPFWLPKARFPGDLGRIYGPQWRAFQNAYSDVPIDQIAKVIDGIKNNPYSRRHIVTAWNPQDLENMALPPCHSLFQFFVAEGCLSLQLYQRSADMFLGVPFNIASYALLLHMVAQVTELKPFEFVHTLGDAHIYLNHLEQVKEQLTREPYPLPKLWLNPEVKDIDRFRIDDIKLEGYQCHPAILAPMAV